VPQAGLVPLSARRKGFGRGFLGVLGPAGLSLACHFVLFFMLTMVTWAVGASGTEVPIEYTARVVKAAHAAGPVGGFHFPGRVGMDRPDTARQGSTISDLASLLAKNRSLQVSGVEQNESELSTLSVKTLRRSDVVGAGVSGPAEQGNGLGERDLAGGGPVGSLWGVGKGQQARSIVYVLDRSGSMDETFGLLQRELKRAIGTLEPDQLFNVIWFNEGPATEWSRRMRKATLHNKRDAFAKIRRIVPSGNTEPLDAIRKGLGYRPDVLFLLSDGAFGEENEAIIKLIQEKNRDKRTIINTILFVYDTMGDGERVLRKIAEMNRGTYKHVTEAEVLQR